ncbi:MAG: hypothetical protein SF052_19725 [Bacteroidia bacterium]|nr:hypothetical protein [Bacteroidia bacterium]
MKHVLHLAVVTFWLIVNYTYGQNRISPEDTFPPSESKLFSFHVPEEQMLKLDMLSLIQVMNTRGMQGVFRIGYERKIFTSWSLAGEISSFWQISSGTTPPSIFISEKDIIGVALGPRYYYNQPARILTGRSADNLSANYFSLNFSTRLMPTQKGWTATDKSGLLYSDNFSIAPGWGFQRRIMRRGFLDFNIGAKFSYGDPVRSKIFHPKGGEKGWQFLPVTSFRMGLAL